ncbi:MAG: redox-regulated ATPase YchF [Bacteroidota bacterium]
MGFKCGIVGLPNVGKSTLFNSLSEARAEAANYPFCTIEPNIGMVTVPDSRLFTLADLVNPQNVVPTVVKIVDIAGLVKGASRGEGLGNQFLGNIQECDAILHVLRCFDDENVVHVEGGVDPIRDKDIIDTELQFKDLEYLERKLEKAKKMTKGGSKDAKKLVGIVEQVIAHIEQGQNARTLDLYPEEWQMLDMALLTRKPVLYVCNVDDDSLPDGNAYVEQVHEAIKNENAESMIISAGFEAELMTLDDEADRREFMEDAGLKEPGLHLLVRKAYDLLRLRTYFTAGEKEVRAWTITQGMKAPQAAGVIHTDFERGFIRAQVIKYDDFVNYKSEAAVKDAGKMSVEGKEYVVEDGDVMHFLFNV